MKLLAIDTSTEACTAGLLVGSAVSERFAVTPRAHAKLILPMVEELLSEAGLAVTDLDGVAFGQGPGSFTGVRIAAGVVQGIAFGADLPVVSVSTLAVMAQGVFREHGAGNILPAIDARMREVYWGRYEIHDGLARNIGEDCVIAPAAVEMPDSGLWTGAGTGWETYRRELEARAGARLGQNIGACFPHAQDLSLLGARMLEQGEGIPAERVQPVYLRDKVADTR